MGSLVLQEKSKAVNKHTSAVHCSGVLTLLQRKISNCLLYHAYYELNEREEHEITIGELCKLIGYAGNNYDAIKTSLKKLISTIIEWNVIDEHSGEEDWAASAILASARIKGAKCYYAYSPRMRALLSSPTKYARINLYIQSKFKSSYGLAVYENCIRYRGLNSTKWFELEQFRKLMGIPSEKYLVFNDFKKRVLDKSIDEVNTYSDMKIKIEYGKVGRKVVKLRFLLSNRQKKSRLGAQQLFPTEVAESTEPVLSNEIQSVFGLSAFQVERMISQYDASYLRDKKDYVQKRFQGKKIDKGSMAAYFVAAVRDDYQNTTVAKTTSPQHKMRTAESVAEEEKQRVADKRLAKQCVALFETLDPIERNNIMTVFATHVNKSLYSKLFAVEGLHNAIIQEMFYAFCKQNKSSFLDELTIC